MKDRILNILLLLTVAAALVITYFKGASSEKQSPPLLNAAAGPTAHPAEIFRARRAAAREKEQTELRALAESGAWSEETRALAEETLRQALRADEAELALEAALAARGYAQALCVYRQGKMTVFTDRSLTGQDAALILDLAREAAGVEAENIRISGY